MGISFDPSGNATFSGTVDSPATMNPVVPNLLDRLYTYGLFKVNSGSVTAGNTIPGSQLRLSYFTSAAVPVLTASVNSPSGTWRNMNSDLTTGQFGLFIRVV